MQSKPIMTFFPLLVFFRDWQSEIPQIQPGEDTEVVKEKGIVFLFCFQNCFMFKMKMLITLSISAFEPYGVPEFKVCVLSKTDRHHSKVVVLRNVMRY